MSDIARWLFELGTASETVDGLVHVSGYVRTDRPPEEVAMMEKAEAYGAYAVFFEAGRNGRPPVASVRFLLRRTAQRSQFCGFASAALELGGIPLIYRKTAGLIQLFRCAHKPDFVSAKGKIVCKPIKTLKTAAAVAAADAWWDASRLRNGTLWDDPDTCRVMLSGTRAAHKQLIEAVRHLNVELNTEGILRKPLRRKLLILSLLIAYLEEARAVLLPDYFNRFLTGATKFFQVLANGQALVNLLADLETRFNGNVFVLEDVDRESLKASNQLNASLGSSKAVRKPVVSLRSGSSILSRIFPSNLLATSIRSW